MTPIKRYHLWKSSTQIGRNGGLFPEMSTPRGGCRAVRLTNGVVIVIGGRDGSKQLSSVETVAVTFRGEENRKDGLSNK